MFPFTSEVAIGKFLPPKPPRLRTQSPVVGFHELRLSEPAGLWFGPV
jgi:hypothetical protein